VFLNVYRQFVNDHTVFTLPNLLKSLSLNDRLVLEHTSGATAEYWAS